MSDYSVVRGRALMIELAAAGIGNDHLLRLTRLSEKRFSAVVNADSADDLVLGPADLLA